MTPKSSTIPAPVGGWNARDSIDSMESTDAITLQNFFPGVSRCKLRKGFATHATGMGTGSVSTVIEYSPKSGTRKLVAGANGKLYDATAADAATEKATGFTSNLWQSVTFANTLVLCNGADQPQQYDGTTVSAATYTGVSDDAKLANVSVYKGRIYFTEAASTGIWYGAPGNVTGALTEFDLGIYLRHGGTLLYAGSWVNDTGSGIQDLFVVISTMGEIIVYSGDYPGATNWGAVGHLFIAPPLGKRGICSIGADLLIATLDGVYGMSNLLANKRDKLTTKIDNAWLTATQLYGSNTGWDIRYYPKGTYTLINIPLATGTDSEQYVVNTDTGAWCRFTGQKAASWATFADNLYFGGVDGKIYKADTGFEDNGSAIQLRCKYAYSYFGDRGRSKRFTMARPMFVGDQGIDMLLDIDVDYEDRQITNTLTVLGQSGYAWDVGTWDESEWDSVVLPTKAWYNISGIGRAGAIMMQGDYKNVSFELSAINIMYEQGGYL